MRFFLLLLLSQANLFAQGNLLFQHISVEQGLSQSSVYDIRQDKQGFMWFATGDGLDRYDGKDFVTYKSHFNDTSSGFLKNRTINSVILEDNYNKLWFSTDAGLLCVDKKYGRFFLKMGIAELARACRLIGIDSANTLWTAVNQKGLYAFSTKDDKKEFYPLPPLGSLSEDKSMFFFSSVMSADAIWLADNTGLIKFDKTTHRYETVIEDKNLTAVFQLHDGRLLVCASNGVYLYNIKTARKQFIPIKNPNGNEFCWISFAEYPATQTVYLGSSKGGELCAFNLLTKECHFSFFQQNNINCLFIDRSENLWLGTEGSGLYKADLKPPKFYCFPLKPIYETPVDQALMVKSIYQDKMGRIWIGSYNKGLIIYDPISRLQKSISLGINQTGNYQFINEIAADSSGRVMVAIADKILWLDAQTYKVVHRMQLPYMKDISVLRPIITSVLEWKRGHYLIGTNMALFSAVLQKNGTMSYWPKSFLTHSSYSAWTYKLQKGNGDTIFVGKRSGFAAIKIVSDTAVQLLDTAFERVGVRHFYQSPGSPVLWMATEQGLLAYHLNTRKYEVFDEKDGLCNSFVYAVLPQSDSSVWLSTNKGISNFTFKFSSAGKPTGHFTNYTVNDGLQSNEFNTGAFFRAGDGTLFLGGINGINWFNPASLHANPHKAAPVITDIFVNNKTYAGDTAAFVQNIILPYSQNTLSFTFKALEFTDPEKNTFSYTLRGFDHDWLTTTSNNARYANLPPGNYTFLLKASNNDGIWNDVPLKVEIIIRPPYWQTWWYRIMIIATMALLGYILVRYYIKQKVKEKTLQLENQKALYDERLRISKDVHDDLGSGLSKITLMAETAKQKAHTGDQGGDAMDHISQISKDLIGNMRDLIWVLNPENTTTDNLVARIREYSSEFLENMGPEVVLEFPEQVPSVHISHEVQRNVFLTIKEVLHNCLKHSNANVITIRVGFDDNNMSISLIDDGRGFDASVLKAKGNGLRNMRHRIEKIGGCFDIVSGAGGTTVKIRVPLT